MFRGNLLFVFKSIRQFTAINNTIKRKDPTNNPDKADGVITFKRLLPVFWDTYVKSLLASMFKLKLYPHESSK